MKISLENFAKAGTGKITVNDLTVICGDNNTGKTFLSYGVYSVFENMRKHFSVEFPVETIQQASKELAENGIAELRIENLGERLSNSLENAGNKITKEFHSYFQAPKGHFQGLKIELDFDGIIDIEAAAPCKFLLPIPRGRIWGEYIHAERKLVFSTHNQDVHSCVGTSKTNKGKSNDDYQEYVKTLINWGLYNVFILPRISVPFPVTSERTGVALFHKIYDYHNDKMIRRIGEDKANNTIDEELASKHAIPIRKNIDRVRFFENVVNDDSFIYSDPDKFWDIIDLHSELIFGGSFHVDNGAIMFHPAEGSNEPKIPIHLASSSLKAQLILYIFIKHVAQRNSILFIDEPELNLFPANQVKMARLIAKLVNAGVKVMLTTHSDFFIREMNNLITLGSIKDIDSRNEVMRDFGIIERDILDFNRVSGYMTTSNRDIKEIEVDQGGINTEILNSVILDENEKSNIFVELLEREIENESCQ